MRSPLDLKGCQVHPSPQSPKGLFRADPEAPTGIGCAPEPNTKFTISADSGEVFRIEQRATVSVGDESEPIGPLAIRALEATTAHFLEQARLIQRDLHKVTAERDAALDQCEDSSGYWQPRVDALDWLVVKRGEELTAVKEALQTSEGHASFLLKDREVADVEIGHLKRAAAENEVTQSLAMTEQRRIARVMHATMARAAGHVEKFNDLDEWQGDLAQGVAAMAKRIGELKRELANGRADCEHWAKIADGNTEAKLAHERAEALLRAFGLDTDTPTDVAVGHIRSALEGGREANPIASPTVFDRVRSERDRLVVEVGNLRHELEQRAEQEAHETSSETDQCDT